MNLEELKTECERLRKNYSKAVAESMKYAADKPLIQGVAIEGVPYELLKSVYDRKDTARMELENFKTKYPGIC